MVHTFPGHETCPTSTLVSNPFSGWLGHHASFRSPFLHHEASTLDRGSAPRRHNQRHESSESKQSRCSQEECRQRNRWCHPRQVLTRLLNDESSSYDGPALLADGALRRVVQGTSQQLVTEARSQPFGAMAKDELDGAEGDGDGDEDGGWQYMCCGESGALLHSTSEKTMNTTSALRWLLIRWKLQHRL